MALEQEGIFIQKITCGGKEIDLSFLLSLVLVETLDLSGPKLIIEFSDPDSILRDDIGVGPGAELEITFADHWHDEGDELLDRFTVLTMPDANEVITLNCLQTDVWALKTPTVHTQMFVKKPIEAILRRFLSWPQVVERFAVREDYHLLPGERPAKMLRQVAREIGAQIFYQRRKVFARRVSTMFRAKAKYEFGYNLSQTDYQIIHYQRPNVDVMMADAVDRYYCGWDMVAGPVWATRQTAAAPELCAATTVPVLDNMSVTPLPEIDFTISGMGDLRPGMTLDLRWDLTRIDSPIDESLPNKILIGTAAHFYKAQKFMTRIKGVVPR